MEELVLTEPEVTPEQVKAKYKIISLIMDHETIIQPQPPPPAVQESGYFRINLKDNLGGLFTHTYIGKEAVDYIKAINTGNFTTKSMNKRILEKLSADGVLPGTVQGTPDPI
jgi:hypothetical protein